MRGMEWGGEVRRIRVRTTDLILQTQFHLNKISPVQHPLKSFFIQQFSSFSNNSKYLKVEHI